MDRLINTGVVDDQREDSVARTIRLRKPERVTAVSMKKVVKRKTVVGKGLERLPNNEDE